MIVDILKRLEFEKSYEFEFADGSVYKHGNSEPEFRMIFRTENALNDCLRRGALGFGESYMNGSIEIEGSLEEASHLGIRLAEGEINPTLLEKIKFVIAYFSRRNSLVGSRKNIEQHYDLGNDFYALWLDKEMQYTCAYFSNEKDSLEKAQLQKLDLVCRKLRLQPGDTVVEAGCGWGGFALYAAQKYKVKIRSFNISKEQIAYARERAKKLGIGEDRIEYVLDDYRNIIQDNRSYDKFVSIGMFEHVGPENYRNLFDIIHQVVKPHGLALVHSISRIYPSNMNAWVEKYIFPGAYIPSLSEMVEPVEKGNRPLHVVDVENLRYHYALTIDHWSERFEKNVDFIQKKYGYNDEFIRMFRLYLKSSSASFRYGGMLLYQMLLSNGYDNGAPLTRSHFIGTGARSSITKVGAANGKGNSSTRSKTPGGKSARAKVKTKAIRKKAPVR